MFITRGSAVTNDLDKKGRKTCQHHTNVVLQLESPFLLSHDHANLIHVSLDFILLIHLEDKLILQNIHFTVGPTRSL